MDLIINLLRRLGGMKRANYYLNVKQTASRIKAAYFTFFREASLFDIYTAAKRGKAYFLLWSRGSFFIKKT